MRMKHKAVTDLSRAGRPVQEKKKTVGFLRDDPSWKEYWWNMPEFQMGDAMAAFEIKVNFFTLADLQKFAKKLGIPISEKCKSFWYPKQPKITNPGEWRYIDED